MANTFTKIDLENWIRKEHFDFFKEFKEPFYGITASVSCDAAYQYCKENGYSFYLFYMHAILRVINEVPALRLRILDDQVVCYDMIDVSPTVLREDRTFGFSYVPFHENFHEFASESRKIFSKVRQLSGLCLGIPRSDVIHFSALPWIHFTAISHARPLIGNDSCPKVSVGKMAVKTSGRALPISIHVHHALVDGIDLGDFYSILQDKLDFASME